MKPVINSLIMLFLSFTTVAQQNVGVGTTTPDASAIMDIVATDKGMLIPRTDTATVNAATTPADGLLIYQTTDSSFYYFNGVKWTPMGATTAGPVGPQGPAGATGPAGPTGPPGPSGSSAFTLSTEYSVNRFKSAGTSYVTMTTVANSICFITQNVIADSDDNDHDVGCRVEVFGATWRLGAYMATNVSDCLCKARCLSW